MQRDGYSADSDSGLKYWAFISYSHADKAWGAWVHRALERYRVPRALVGRTNSIGKVPRRVFPIFRDRDELPGASSLAEKITESLVQSRFLIVICSPKSAVSQYVDKEVKSFKRLGREDRVLCLIVDGEPGASAAPQSGLLEAFPEAVRYRVGPDGEITDRPAEPLAADVRKDKDGKTNAKLKLLAGILGVGYDELKQREKRRRRWRTAQLAVLILLIAGAIWGVWWNRQQVAQEQSLIAEARKVASDSVDISEKEADRRLRLALRSVNLTRERYGYVLPEAEIALYRALTESALRGTFVETHESAGFGGWTWPVVFAADSNRMLAPSALGPSIILSADADKITVLKDPDVPYEHDYVATFTRDGHAVTGGSDGVVRFWTPDGRMEKRFRAHAADVLVVDQSADTSLLLTVGCDKGRHQSCETRSARLWTNTGEPLASFAHDEAQLLTATLSPDGQRVVTAGETGVLRFWHRSGQYLFQITEGSYWLTRANFSPDGRRLVTGGCHPYLDAGMFSPLPARSCPQRFRGAWSSLDPQNADPKVNLYDYEGKLLKTLPGRLAAFDRRGTRLLTARDECDQEGTCRGRVHVWRPDGAFVTSFATDSPIVDVGFSPDGQFIVVAESETVTVHGLDGRVVFSFGGFLKEITSVRFSDDGDRIATVSCPNGHQGACLERAIHVWDPNGPLLKSQELLSWRDPRFSLQQLGATLRFSPSGRFLFVATDDGVNPVLWNTETDEVIRLPGRTDIVLNAIFDSTEKRILMSSRNNEANVLEPQRIQIWDVHGRQKVLQEIYREDMDYAPLGASQRRIATGDSQGHVYVWDWNGDLVGQNKGHSTGIVAVDVSLTDDAVVTVDREGRALIWDTPLSTIAKIDASVLNTPPEGGWIQSRFDTVYRARFTRDGQRLIILGPKNISMWDRQGRRLWDVDVDTVDFTAPQVSKDRVLVVRCNLRGRGASLGGLRECYDSAVTLWDLSGRFLATLDPGSPRETLVAVAEFNRQGNRIITVEKSGTTRLWDANGNLIVNLFTPARTADFDPMGRRLATVSDGGRVNVWQTWDDLRTMIAEAERRLQRLAQQASGRAAK